MQTNSFEHERKLQSQTPITVLTIISLILTFICSLTTFTYYSSGYSGTYEFHFFLFSYGILHAIASLLSYFISVAPVFLFALYIFKYRGAFRTTGTISAVLGVIAFFPLSFYLVYLSLGLFPLYSIFDFLRLLSSLLVMVSFALASISLLKGFSKKIYIFVAVFCGLLYQVVSLLPFIFYNCKHYITSGFYVYLFTTPLSVIGFSALYIALLLFVLKNNIPKPTHKEKNTKTMSPEQSLKILRDKFEIGAITEEEYQAQRAEIISNL